MNGQHSGYGMHNGYAGAGMQGGVDPQGFLGSLLGRFAGRALGKLVGGSTGQTIGGLAGSIGGGLLPLSAGPGQQGGSSEQIDEVELLGFWSTLQKIARGVGKGVDVGRDLGLFQAGGPQMGQQGTEQLSELELQSFWSVLRKIGRGVGTGVDIGRGLGLFGAGGPQMGQQGSQSHQGGAQLSELELQSFWSVLRKIGRGVGTGVDIGRGLGLFGAGGPQMGQQSGQGAAEEIDEVELLGFWSTLQKIARGVGKGVDVGRDLGLFQAGGPQMGQQGTEQLSELELQSFWSVLRKIGRGVGTGVDIGRGLGLFGAGGPQMGQQGSQSHQGGAQLSELELQSFWSVLRKIGRGVGTGVDIGRGLGLFGAGGPQTGQQGGVDPQMIQLLQQAMPALQALAGQQQGRQGYIQ